MIDAAAPAGQSASLQQLAQLTISQHTECVVRLRTLPAEGAGGGTKFKLVSVLVRALDGQQQQPHAHAVPLRKHHRPGG